jgi:hypothetical protein
MPYPKIARLGLKRGSRLNHLSSFSFSASLLLEARPEIQQLSDTECKRRRMPHDDGSLGR